MRAPGNIAGGTGLALAVFVAASLQAKAAAVDDDVLLVIVHPKNSVRALDALELAAIYTSSKRFWPNGQALVAFNSPPRSESRVLFDRAVLRMDPDQAGRFWVDHKVSGQAPPPRKVPSARVASAVVRKLPAAIAYVPAETCPQGVRVVAVVRQDGVHPPPANPEDLCGK